MDPVDEMDTEEKQLRSVALQNAQSILLARQKAEAELIAAKESLEQKTQALAHSLALMQATLASIGDAVITTDTQGRVDFLNGVAESLTGWRDREAAGQPLERVFHVIDEQTRQRVANPAQRALAEGTTVGLSSHALLISKDGVERPVDDCASPIKDEQGKIVGAVLVFRDITGRKVAEELVLRGAEANAKFRSMFEQGTQFAGVLSLDGVMVEANRLCLDFCGFTRDEVIGKPFWECGWWNRSAEVMEKVRAASLGAAAGIPFRGEMLYFFADGTERYTDLSITPVTDDHGHVPFVVAIGADITDRKQAETQLRESEQRLRETASELGRLAGDLSEADRRKNEFLAMLAHELRNPLAPIRNAVQIIRHSAGNDALAGVVEMMDRQVRQMVRLVDDLLDISRISRGKIELRRERVDLLKVVSEAVEAASSQMQANEHTLTVHFPEQPFFLHADAARLAQVIGNLLNNACKFTKRGGQIELNVAVDEPREPVAVIKILDNGIGIAREQLPKIFEMFVQADTSLERSVSGLGIGLTLVKTLVEMHGGTIEADSAGVGLGSEFIVRFPMIRGEEKPATERSESSGKVPAPQLANHSAARRILVVDDNRDSALSLAMWLKLNGNETRTAFDGLSAVTAAGEFKPDVVLLDIGLPKLNGYETARTIRQEPWGKKMTLVALTGWGQDDDRRKSKEAGFDDHLVKPVDFATLAKLLAALPASHSAQ